MAQSLSKIFVHVIFSTKERYPYLSDPDIRRSMHAYLATVYRVNDCPALLVGGTADHVHVLCTLASTRDIAGVVRETKRKSSLWVKNEGRLLSKFYWQKGYGAFSLGRSQVDDVLAYIRNQENHHRRASFKDEFRRFLDLYNIEYDERYVWD